MHATRLHKSAKAILRTSIAVFVLAGAAQVHGVDATFSSAALEGGDQDANVGLNPSKTYEAAVNENGGDLTINGVTFTTSSQKAVLSGITAGFNTFTPEQSFVNGQLGELLKDFNYGGNPGTITLSDLIVGQTYVFTNYAGQFGAAGGRLANVAATSGVSTTYDENLSQLNLLRYTFTATQPTEVLTFTPLRAADSWHFYGYTSEQVFDNNRSLAGDWTTAAAWSKAVPAGAGTNANFSAPAGAATVNLDANQTVGHLQFAGTGANSWTLSTANNSVLTLQADVGGVSVLSTPAADGTHTIAAPVTLASDILKTGGGRLVFSGAITDNGRSINIGSGELEFANVGAQTLTGAVSGAGDLVKAGAGTLTLNGELSYTGTTVISSGTLEVGGAANSTLSGIINGAGGLLKSGAGTLTLTANNTYTGDTVIAGGTLKLQGLTAVAQQVGTASFQNSDTFTFAAAENNLLAGLLPSQVTNTFSGADLTAGPGVLTDGASPAFSLDSRYAVGNSASLTYSLGDSPVGYDLTAVNLFTGWQDNGRSQITISDISYATAADPTTFIPIVGSSNDYAGEGGNGAIPDDNLSSLTATGGLLASGVSAIRFNFGAQENGWVGYSELEVVGTESLATGTNILPANSAVRIAGGATLDLNGVTQTVASLSDSGAAGGSIINDTSVPVTLTINPAEGSTTFSGIIDDNGSTNAISVVKSGDGTQVLAGANTYTGATTIVDGILAVTGSLTGTAKVDVQSGGTLSGDGDLILAGAGSVNLLAGGKLAPGVDAGTLTATFSGGGQLDLSLGVTAANSQALVFDLGAPAASDKITLTGGALSIGTGVLNFDDFAFNPVAGFGEGTYTLFDADRAFVGTLGTSLTGAIGAFEATISENAATNDLVLTVVPEPGVAFSAMVGLAGLIGFRRRRRA